MHFGSKKGVIFIEAFRVHECAELVLAVLGDKDIGGLDVAVEDAGVFNLLQNLTHLQTEVDNLVLGEALVLHHLGQRLAVVGDNEHFHFFFFGVVVDDDVHIVADIAQTLDGLYKISLVLDVFDVILIVETSREFVIGELRFLLRTVAVFADELIDFALVSVGSG